LFKFCKKKKALVKRALFSRSSNLYLSAADDSASRTTNLADS